MATSLITGANKGLGFETARQLIAAGHHVWIGARDSDRGQQAADQLGAGFVQLDVTDDASVAAAAATVGELDVLVNNAGISGGRISPSEAISRTCGSTPSIRLHSDRLQPASRRTDRRGGRQRDHPLCAHHS